MQKKANPGLWYRFSQSVLPHIVLIAFAALAMFPIILILINSFKTRKAIFSSPVSIPLPGGTFSLEGYETVFDRANFPLYFGNSLIVTVVSILLRSVSLFVRRTDRTPAGMLMSAE